MDRSRPVELEIMASFSLSGGLKKRYGLIVPSAVAASGSNRQKATTSKRRSVFGDEEDGQSSIDDDDDEYDEKRFDDEPATSKETNSTVQQPPAPHPPPPPLIATTEAKQSKRVAELHQQALAEDETVFDYDAVYDQIKADELQQKLEREGVSQKRESRYIGSMMQQAEERAKQEIRIRERRIHRELEREMAENPELAAGKVEAFVTDAYKEQQGLIKQMEEEERRKAEEEGRAAGKSFVGFYKNLLNVKSRKLPAPLTKPLAEIPSQAEESKSENSIRGGLSSEEPRQLKGGINLLKKPASYIVGQKGRSRESAASVRGASGAGRYGQSRQQEAERMSREFEQQLLERQREEEQRKQVEEEQLRTKWARQANSETISDARKRYEERKRQRMATIKDE